MAEAPSFATAVARLLDSRGQKIESLMRVIGIAEPDFQAMFNGGAPDQSFMRRLATALGLREADLFVLAGLTVPNELMPFDVPPGRILDDIVKTAIRLSPERRQQLLRLAKSIPRRDRVVPPAPERDPFQYSPGAVVVRLLRNRNLSNLNSAKMLYRLAGIGPLSAATIQVVGYGRKELSNDLLHGFATVLGFRVEDLSALIDVQLTHAAPPIDVGTNDVAELIWLLRDCSADQLSAIQGACMSG